MEYIFGRTICNGIDMDNLKTVGEEHSDLDGAMSITREYADSYITDTFRIVEKYRSKEGSDGLYYDWYVIKDHYRYIDKYTPASGEINAAMESISEAVDIVMTEELPAQSDQIDSLSDAIDDILTNVIPNLIEED